MFQVGGVLPARMGACVASDFNPRPGLATVAETKHHKGRNPTGVFLNPNRRIGGVAVTFC